MRILLKHVGTLAFGHVDVGRISIDSDAGVGSPEVFAAHDVLLLLAGHEPPCCHSESEAAHGYTCSWVAVERSPHNQPHFVRWAKSLLAGRIPQSDNCRSLMNLYHDYILFK